MQQIPRNTNRGSRGGISPEAGGGGLADMRSRAGGLLSEGDAAVDQVLDAASGTRNIEHFRQTSGQ